MRKAEELLHGCMAKAHDDEMTFVLLARDLAAPGTIRMWVAERLSLGLNKITDAKIVEALACADTMVREQRE